MTRPTKPRWLLAYAAAMVVAGPNWWDQYAGAVIIAFYSLRHEQAMLRWRRHTMWLTLTADVRKFQQAMRRLSGQINALSIAFGNTTTEEKQ